MYSFGTWPVKKTSGRASHVPCAADWSAAPAATSHGGRLRTNGATASYAPGPWSVMPSTSRGFHVCDVGDVHSLSVSTSSFGVRAVALPSAGARSSGVGFPVYPISGSSLRQKKRAE